MTKHQHHEQKIELVDISTIRAGDTIVHDGKLRTVCNNNIQYCSFMGITLFGDSYKSGHTKVKLVANLRNR